MFFGNTLAGFSSKRTILLAVNTDKYSSSILMGFSREISEHPSSVWRKTKQPLLMRLECLKKVILLKYKTEVDADRTLGRRNTACYM